MLDIRSFSNALNFSRLTGLKALKATCNHRTLNGIKCNHVHMCDTSSKLTKLLYVTICQTCKSNACLNSRCMNEQIPQNNFFVFVLEEEEINTRGNSLFPVVFIITLQKVLHNSQTNTLGKQNNFR